MAITANDVIKVMQSWVGKSRAAGTHKDIVDLYNSHKPLARGYAVTYSDSYCDATVSAAFIKLNAVNLIGGTECGVERHIELFKKAGIWEENGKVKPEPGWIVCFNWDDNTQPNDGFADHIGIVEKVSGNTITTIEGNYNGNVARREMPVGWGYIRGYAKPKYATTAQNKVSSAPAAAPKTYTVIDVSEWQDTIDWAKVKPQIDAAIIRVMDGLDHEDKQFVRNVTECERYGIPYGLYVYSRGRNASYTKAEYVKAKQLLGDHKPALPWFIDIEENSLGVVAKIKAKAWCDAVRADGNKYGVYTGAYYYRNFLAGFSYDKCSLWIAAYGTNDGTKQEKFRPSIGVNYDGWQYTSAKKLNGIAGATVDVSEFKTIFGAKKTADAPVKEEPKSSVKKSIDEIADEIIADRGNAKWKTGAERINLLTKAGYNANAVQKRVNEKLKGSNSISYTIKRGDTLSSIGKAYGVSYIKIAADNKIANPNKIYVGQVIKINR